MSKNPPRKKPQSVTRLLMAHARGARIQGLVQSKGPDGKWTEEWESFNGEPFILDRDELPQPGSMDAGYYRVIAEDEHLNYGVLSGALRERVLYGRPGGRATVEFAAAINVAMELFDDAKGWNEFKIDSVGEGQLLLFLAEWLADELHV